MIIVSQNKCEITTDINIFIEESWRGFCIKNIVIGILGVYETEERAKEVLQEIIDTYSEFPKEKNNNPLNLEARLALQGMVNNFITVPKIYYMPKE